MSHLPLIEKELATGSTGLRGWAVCQRSATGLFQSRKFLEDQAHRRAVQVPASGLAQGGERLLREEAARAKRG